MQGSNHGNRVWSADWRRAIGIWLWCILVGVPSVGRAICGLDGAVYDRIGKVQDLATARSWSRQFARQPALSCFACHQDGYGPRNAYGSAINILLTGNDREDIARKREAGRRVSEIPADPSLPDSPTFGDLIERGVLPGTKVAEARSSVPQLPPPLSEEITAQQARDLVRLVGEQSRFGILQLSRTDSITEETARVLAGFRGEMLILGIRSLSPAVARELASSQVATVWLHSITRLDSDTAAVLATRPGQLVMSGLVELDSVPLAEKLALRPGALSFPHLKRISPAVAVALGKYQRGLSLGGLADVPVDVQDALATAVGPLTIPNLRSLDSDTLTTKLAQGYASAVLLPAIRELSVAQAQQIATIKRPFFLSGIQLPVSVMTEEVAAVFANNPGAGRLDLGIGPLSDPPLAILMRSPVVITLREVESLNDEQVRILSLAPSNVPGGFFGGQPKLALPKLRTLESPLLAATLLRASQSFSGVTTLTPEAAAALAAVPDEEQKDANGVVRNRRAYGLSFPSLGELRSETAQVLMTRRWAGISLPSISELSVDAARGIVRRTSNLTLGVNSLNPEVAAVFSDLASNGPDLGGGTLSFPSLSDMTPAAARVLVNALNRGTEVPTWGGLNQAPQLYLGGRFPSGLANSGSSPSLSPELAAELGRYRGLLSIASLQELTPDSAAALTAYSGPFLDLSGPAIDNLSVESAAELARYPGELRMPLRVLNSVPLAEKLARQRSRAFDELEVVADEVIPRMVSYNGFFTLRRLADLRSPELAKRLLQDSTGHVLPCLRTITPEAAAALAESRSTVYLGLRVLDDPAVARILAQAQKGANLPQLRAATPEVIAILKAAPSVKTVPLESLYVLAAQ